MKWNVKTWWGAGDSGTVLSSSGYISSLGDSGTVLPPPGYISSLGDSGTVLPSPGYISSLRDSWTVPFSPGYISSLGTIVASLLAWGKTLSSFLPWGETSAFLGAWWGVSLILEDGLGDSTSGKRLNVFMVWERENIELGLGKSIELGGLGRSRLGERLMDTPWIEMFSEKWTGISSELFEGEATLSEIFIYWVQNWKLLVKPLVQPQEWSWLYWIQKTLKNTFIAS